jgi:hypothetical protein
MKKLFQIIALVLSPVLSSFAQDTTCNVSFDPTTMIVSIDPIELPECPYTIENAEKNIENEFYSIVISGGFQGFPEMDSSRCALFQKKYNVSFSYEGCMRVYDITNEDFEGYNKTMFEALTLRYGAIVKTEFNALYVKKRSYLY